MPASDKFFYNLKTLHVVFAISSVVMFISSVWMMAADHDDEWRDWQSKWSRIQSRQLQEGIHAIQTEEYQSDVASLRKKIDQAEADLQQNEAAFKKLSDEVETLALDVDLASRAVRDQRAARDVARANYDLGIRDNLGQKDLGDLKAIFDGEQGKVDKLELEHQQKETKLQLAEDKLKEQTGRRETATAELKKLQSDVQRLHAALEKVDPDSWLASTKRKIMEWPFIDGFNSDHKIIQDWLPDLKITLGMTRTARFDRCRTCHLGILQTQRDGGPTFPFGEVDSTSIKDWFEAKKFPHPFATHPNTALYVAATSPHPVTTFGCTICHDGNGAGTSFQNAEHGPNDPHQGLKWEKKNHYHLNHFWQYPMQPKRFIGSTCIKCHHSVTELGVNPRYGATAPKVYRGYQLIRKYGCFGCHEIHGYEAGKPIGPDLRLEPATPEEAAKIAGDPRLFAGKMRKVGPALRHIAAKTTRGWLEYWIEEPKRFRPTTRMPQFFKLTNHLDPEKLEAGEIDLEHVQISDLDPEARRFVPVEVAAITEYLLGKSQGIELLKPADDYRPDPQEGRKLFARSGCLACHRHESFEDEDQREGPDYVAPESRSDFGPDLSKVHEKIKPGPEGINWLYTWIREPKRHHPRTKMPNLFLEPFLRKVKRTITRDGQKTDVEVERTIDPAADIAAFLLEGGPVSYDRLKFEPAALDDLLKLYLSKALTAEQVETMFKTRKYPYSPDEVTGDEIELARGLQGEDVDDRDWQRVKLNYLGLKTIWRFGCYGCHDIPGFETARPIGTTLQDWGRKDTSKLATWHIEEYLLHHGEPDGSSTQQRVHDAIQRAAAGDFKTKDEEEREMTAAFFTNNLLHHGRAGFLWQKLRQPRSYDYKKTETKAYNERLRMPKSFLSEDEIEAIAAFVLGLVAEPPGEQYLYRPRAAEADRIEGERLLAKYNCAGCHVLDLPEITYGVDPDDLFASGLDPAEHPQGLELLLKLKPPRNGETGRTIHIDDDGDTLSLPEISFHGLVYRRPDPDDDLEDQEFYYDLWETLDVFDKRLLPGSRMIVPARQLVSETPGRGGKFAEWLVESLMQTTTEDNRFLAWQMVPPPLYREGIKVQTPWLYQFLKDPTKLRHVTVLRMPRFNMSDEEAQSLANYFAAVDGAPYPYQQVPQREPEYLHAMNQQFQADSAKKNTDYLAESWKLLNAPLCIKCHSLGGRQFQVFDPQKDIRGPDLQHVADRLRSEWTLLWLYKPQWITPYTSMPLPLAKNQKQFEEFFDGDAGKQTIALRDALMNYHRLMEREGVTIPKAPAATRTQGGGN